MKKQASTSTTAAKARSGVGATGERTTPLRAQVLLMARKRCDEMQDSQAARDQMKREVLEMPTELLADLLVALSTARIDRALLLSPTTTAKE